MFVHYTNPEQRGPCVCLVCSDGVEPIFSSNVNMFNILCIGDAKKQNKTKEVQPRVIMVTGLTLPHHSRST